MYNEAEKQFRISQTNFDVAVRTYRINRLRFENGDIIGQVKKTLKQTSEKRSKQTILG